MNAKIAPFALYGGARTYLIAALEEMAKEPTWTMVITPAHIFQLLAAALTVAGALYTKGPSRE